MHILLVDDDPLIEQSIRYLARDEFRLTAAHSADEALRVLEREEIDGALLDINLGEASQDGMELLRQVKQKYPNMPVVMTSGQNAATVIVRCIQLGADDFIEKPFDTKTLTLRLSKAFTDTRRNRVFKRAFELTTQKNVIVGETIGIQTARRLVERAGRMRILFQGETGVGKTPFAFYSNQVVSREEGHPRPFEQVNCAGLTKEHFQDQLFGHKKGAFTGAISDKCGLVEIAKGGDLFLDEVGEMALDTQALFLTFIDTQEYYRLGDDQKKKANVRILCATNRDLKKMVAEGTFRKDLYSRIAQVVVDIPPLRQRAEDIPALLQHFVEIFAGFSKPVSQEASRLLRQYTWEEGNVRELRDTVEYLCVLGRDAETLDVEHLPDRVRPYTAATDLPPTEQMGAEDWMRVVEDHGLESCLNAVEKRILEHYVRQNQGVTDHLVKMLRTSKPTLYRRLRQYGIAADMAH